ncbi:DNA-(apurinic or apyrimidinic site) endonuclease 2 isoform X1 [Bufo gargarizans]|uniref:DNA-(apurinic or apyrimidinic site) endonuclease 2 isoform X1 n=2 Tax=Bufo gargarizans TaxID=30331 RepID=UPI001CF445B9|nr:DNA-(apurinic or apyrimidinic site) endonuclease 2 isoform X1 [Bufo gargarizans]
MVGRVTRFFSVVRMKIVSWNINGIRATRVGLKEILDSLDADIICLQETKVTRDLLEEPVAIVEGYNSYFSFCRVRSGYSGVATFCKNTTTPLAAEEGLSGQLNGHKGSIGCYGNTEEFSEEELLSLDQEGRAVITQHTILTADGKEDTLTVINVYCPRADPEKPERKTYKLRFYRLLQIRAETILRNGGHVIILGDVNTSHKPLDHCDPTDLEVFEENPGRQWLNQFLADPTTSKTEDANQPNVGGLFLDSFRYFHPTQKNAFTCWCSASGARQTNYGTRIDYILANRKLVEAEFLDSIILPEVEGSDHCPVKVLMKCFPLAALKCPSLCTKYLPEFAGRQQKLSQFLVRKNKYLLEVSTGDTKEQSSSQSSSESSEPSAARKRTNEKVGGSNGKKGKPGPKSGQGSLLGFFKPVVPKSTALSNGEKKSVISESETKNVTLTTQQGCSLPPTSGSQNGNQPPTAFWKTLLKGPPPPPNCKGHGEPCVLRTVKKSGPNCGRQFYVCARPVGHSSNPQARCNFFLWVNKKSGADG